MTMQCGVGLKLLLLLKEELLLLHLLKFELLLDEFLIFELLALIEEDFGL